MFQIGEDLRKTHLGWSGALFAAVPGILQELQGSSFSPVDGSGSRVIGLDIDTFAPSRE